PALTHDHQEPAGCKQACAEVERRIGPYEVERDLGGTAEFVGYALGSGGVGCRIRAHRQGQRHLLRAHFADPHAEVRNAAQVLERELAEAAEASSRSNTCAALRTSAWGSAK